MEQESNKELALRDLIICKLENPEKVPDEDIIKRLELMKSDWLEVRRRQKHDEQWGNNVSFYSGDQYVRQRNRGQDTGYRVRLRENHTNNIVQRIVSIVMQNMPVTRVFAASDDWTDRKDAEYSEDYAKYFWRKKKLESVIAKWIKYSCIFGDGFIHGSWNPDVGEPMDLDPEETGDGSRKTMIWTGDIELSVDQPLTFIPRPGYEELDDMPDYIRSKPAGRAALEAAHGPLQADGVKFGGASTNYFRIENEMVMKNEYYHKPTSWWPEGCYVCWVGNKLLKISPFPYRKFSKLPTVRLGFDSIPGRFFRQAPLDQLIDLQEQLNKAASMITEARNLMARPRWWVSHEAEVAAQSITDRPGDILRYKAAGGKPEPIVASFNFNELASNKADLRNAMGQVSGISSASRGDIPSATRTALALQLVLEQDRSQFLPFIKDMHQGVLDLMYMILSMTAEFIGAEDPRVIKIEGNSRPRLFHGGMIPSPLDIYLEDTNPLGWTAGGRIEATMELVDRGLIKDTNQALEMIKIHSTDPAYRIQDINKESAEKENEDLMQGKIFEPLNEDDDIIHLDVHLRLASSYEYRSYPPQVQKAITYHINKHKERLAKFGAAMTPEDPGDIPGKSQNPKNSLGEQLSQPAPNMDQLLQQ